MIYETLGLLRVFEDGLVGPPLPHVPVAVVVSAAVVEAVCQLVAEDGANSTVIQSPEIEKVSSC